MIKLLLKDGQVVVRNGMPVYVDDAGKEIEFDANHAMGKITQLNGESQQHRERAEAAELKLKPFAEIEDPVAATAALKTVKNLKDGDLVKAGDVQRIKDEAIAATVKQWEPIKVERDKLANDLNEERIGGAFTRSKFISDKIIVPAEMVRSHFGTRFKLENGKVVGYGADGKAIFSRTKAGDIAEFDEALEIMVEGFTHRDSILKGKTGTGGGHGGEGGGGQGSGKTMTRAAFNQLDATAQGAKMKEGFTLTDS